MRGAIVALVLAWAAIAHAQAGVSDPLRAAIAEGRFGDAYARAGELVAAHGDDVDVRYYAAVACLRVARFHEAEQHLAAGLAKHPGNVDLLGLRAQILLSAGDEAGAKAIADEALARDPEAIDAALAREEIDLGVEARARLAGAESGLPDGSPTSFVDGVVAGIAAGDSPREIAEAFDLEILASAPPAERTRAGLVRGIETVLRDARAARERASQQFLGWVTLPEARPFGDRVIVDVLVPIDSTITERQREGMVVAAADPALRGTLDPTLLALIEGVPEAERDALLDRMVGVRMRSLLELHFEVAGTEGAYRITDLAIGAVSMKDQLGNFSKVMDQVDPPRAGWRLTPELIGTLAGVVVGVVVLVVLATRRRRR